jgi:hypothetical protein
VPQTVERSSFIGKGRIEKAKTPAQCGESWEVTVSVRCLREVREIETLAKAGPVQRQKDHSASPGSRTLKHGTLTWQGSASHVPCRQGVLTRQNVAATYCIERTSSQGVEQQSSNKPRLRTRTQRTRISVLFMIPS